jgi:hypothetical protein
MNRKALQGSTGKSDRFLTWLSAVMCLFLFSCAQGGGLGTVLDVAGTDGGGTGGTSGNTGASPVCGDGEINGIEQCDGINLGGTTCGTLGEGTGTLSCTLECTFDLSMCSGAASSAGSGGYGGA